MTLARQAERLVTLARLVTVRQVIEAGDAAIDAAGLDSWCMNEGLADGSERIGLWWTRDLVEKIRELESLQGVEK